MILFLLLSPIKLTGLTIFESQPDLITGEDTYIREGSDTNYGTATTIKIGKTAVGSEFRGLIKINTSSIPETDTVINAKLQVYLSTASNNNSMTIKIYRITSNWSQTETSWNNAYTNNAKMIALRTGDNQTGQWVSEKRNVRKDLKQRFGKEINEIHTVAIMTDSDNTKQQATGYYGDIYFSTD